MKQEAILREVEVEMLLNKYQWIKEEKKLHKLSFMRTKKESIW
jgi:hypothetical protein